MDVRLGTHLFAEKSDRGQHVHNIVLDNVQSDPVLAAKPFDRLFELFEDVEDGESATTFEKHDGSSKVATNRNRFGEQVGSTSMARANVSLTRSFG